MNRRSLLAMIGLAPAAAVAAPALAVPASRGRWLTATMQGGFLTPNDMRQAASLEPLPLASEVMQFDEGVIARSVRAELMRMGFEIEPEAPTFSDGDGI